MLLIAEVYEAEVWRVDEPNVRKWVLVIGKNRIGVYDRQPSRAYVDETIKKWQREVSSRKPRLNQI